MSKESIFLQLQYPTTFRFFSFFLFLLPEKESAPTCELSRCLHFLRLLRSVPEYKPFVLDLLLPQLLDPASSSPRCCFRQTATQSRGLADGKPQWGGGGRVAQLQEKLASSSRPSTVAMQPSKNGFCHTSRTSNGINVCVSARCRLIACRALQHANVMHG